MLDAAGTVLWTEQFEEPFDLIVSAGNALGLEAEGELSGEDREFEGAKTFVKIASDTVNRAAQAKGGDLGWFSLGGMVKPFSDAVAKLQKGGVSTEPVQTQFGWHVIEVLDRRLGTPSFEETEPRLRCSDRTLKFHGWMPRMTPIGW